MIDYNDLGVSSVLAKGSCTLPYELVVGQSTVLAATYIDKGDP